MSFEFPAFLESLDGFEQWIPPNCRCMIRVFVEVYGDTIPGAEPFFIRHEVCKPVDLKFHVFLLPETN